MQWRGEILEYHKRTAEHSHNRKTGLKPLNLHIALT